eukprot:1171589-Amphidinium_carterae.1
MGGVSFASHQTHVHMSLTHVHTNGFSAKWVVLALLDTNGYIVHTSGYSAKLKGGVSFASHQTHMFTENG